MRRKVFIEKRGALLRTKAIAFVLSASLASSAVSVVFPMSISRAEGTDKSEINGAGDGGGFSSDDVEEGWWKASGERNGTRFCLWNYYTERLEWYDFAEWMGEDKSWAFDGDPNNDSPLSGGFNYSTDLFDSNSYDLAAQKAFQMNGAYSEFQLIKNPATGNYDATDSYRVNHDDDPDNDAANAIFVGDSDWTKHLKVIQKLNSNKARNEGHHYDPHKSIVLPGGRSFTPILEYSSTVQRPSGMDSATWEKIQPPTSPLGILAWSGNGAQSVISKAMNDISTRVGNRLGIYQITYILDIVGIISAILIIIFSLVELLIVNTPILMGIVKLRVAHGFLTVIIILLLPFIFDIFMTIVRFFMSPS